MRKTGNSQLKPEYRKTDGPNKKPKVKSRNNGRTVLHAGVQVAIVAGMGVLIGYYADSWFESSKPFYTLIFGLTFSIVALYLFIKQFIR